MSNSLIRLKDVLANLDMSGEVMAIDQVAFVLADFHSGKVVDVRKELLDPTRHKNLLFQFEDIIRDTRCDSRAKALLVALGWQEKPGFLGEVASLLVQVYR